MSRRTPPDESPAATPRASHPSWFIVLGLMAGVLALGGLYGFDAFGARALSAISQAWAALEAAPAPIYFGIMSVAILAPVPASAFYITAGPLYGIGTSLLWIAPALALNAFLVHWIASSMLRPHLERLVARSGRVVPRMRSKRDETLFIVLIRVTPGIPYFVQNWILGLADVRRTPFILLSVAIQMIYAAGFVILGRSAFEGRFGLALTAIALLVVASLIARGVHLRLGAVSREPEGRGPE